MRGADRLLRRVRRLLQPVFFRYWLRRRMLSPVATRVAGMRLLVLPTVFHPRYFGSSSILADFVSRLELRGARLLDMGTGTGVVALAAARAGARVTAVDVNPVAVDCARRNASDNGIEIEVVESDLFDSLEDRRFDIIAWNPPFFPREPIDVAERAWFAGRDCETIARFAAASRPHLEAGGRIFLVLSEDAEVGRIERMFESNGFRIARALARRWGLGETMVVLEAR